MRRLARFCAIEPNTLLSWPAWLTSKYISGLVAQLRSRSALPLITRTVYILILSALALVQTFSVRESIEDSVDDQRFCVLSPSVSTMMTLSRSGAAAGALNGA